MRFNTNPLALGAGVVEGMQMVQTRDNGAGLVERDAALSAVDEAINAVGRDRLSCLAIEGAPGLGRSAMLTVVRHRAAASGLRVITGDGADAGRHVPLGLVHALFPPTSSVDQPACLADQVAAELRSGDPLALIIDNLDLVDNESLILLAHAVRNPRHVPLLLVLAGRVFDDASPGGNPLYPAATRVVRLRPLTADGARRMAERMLGGITDEVITACHLGTGGIPALMAQLFQHLGPAKRMGGTAGAVAGFGPFVIAPTLSRWLDTYPPEVVAVIQAAAILGTPHHLSSVADLAAVTPTAAASAARVLIRDGLLATAHPVGWSGELIRAAVYERIPESDRGDWHGRAAQVLHDGHAENEEIAAHLLLAPPAKRPWAAGVLAAAATAAGADGRVNDSVALLRRALAECSAAEESELRLRLACALLPVDRRSALDELRPAGRLPVAVREPSAAAIQLAYLLAFRGLGADAEQLLDALAGDATTDGHRRLIQLLSPTGARRAIADAADTANALTTALAAARSCWAGNDRGRTIDLAADVLADEVACDDSPVALWLAVSVLMYADETGRAAQLLGSGRAAWDRRPALDLVTKTLQARLAYRTGNIPDALALASTAVNVDVDAGVDAGSPPAWLGGHAVLADAYLDSADPVAAGGVLARAGVLTASVDGWQHHEVLASRARLRLAEGDHEAALRDFLDCGSQLATAGIVNPAVSSWRSGAARAHLALDRWTAARRLAHEELDLARAWGSPVALSIALRAAARFTEPKHELTMMTEAVDCLTAKEDRLELARALGDRGVLLSGQGQAVAARANLRRAADLARQCGAVALNNQLHTALIDAGGRPRRRATTGPEALTAREHEVCAFAAQGKTNRDIAATLFVTRRAVEMYLTRAYRKLGIAGRSLLPDMMEAR